MLHGALLRSLALQLGRAVAVVADHGWRGASWPEESRHQDRGELALTIKTFISPLTSCLSVTGTQACGGTSDAENLQLCDTCDRGCHVACGKLRRVPGRAGWHCSGCCAAAGKTGQAGSRLHKAGAAAVAAARQLDNDSEDDDFKPAKASAGLG